MFYTSFMKIPSDFILLQPQTCGFNDAKCEKVQSHWSIWYQKRVKLKEIILFNIIKTVMATHMFKYKTVTPKMKYDSIVSHS